MIFPSGVSTFTLYKALYIKLIIMLSKLKLKIIIFFISLLLINIKKIIKIDNLINEVAYQDDFNFSKYETKYKILSIFYPDNFFNNNESVYNQEFQLLSKKKEKINALRLDWIGSAHLFFFILMQGFLHLAFSYV